MANDKKVKILLVDDEKNILNSCARLLRKVDAIIFKTTDASEAIEWFKNNEFAVVISDQRMPEIQGTELLAQLREINEDSVRILLTGYADTNAAIDAINKGAVYKYLSKPWNNDDVLNEIQAAIDIYSQKKKDSQVAKHYESAWAQKSAMGGLW